MRDQSADKFLPTLPDEDDFYRCEPLTLRDALLCVVLVPITYFFIAGFLCL